MVTFTRKIEIIENYFGKGKLSAKGNDIAVQCKSKKCIGSGKKKLSISLIDHRFNCWVCGFSGKNIGYYIAKGNQEIIDIFGVKGDIDEDEEVIDFPHDFRVLYPYYEKKYRDPDINQIIKYLKKRGITKQVCEKYAIGISSEEKFRNRFIIPSFDCNGDINYYSARRVFSSAGIKYVNAGAKREDIIFNEIFLDFSKKLTLVEGPLDSILGIENSVPILGSFLNEKYDLFQKIVKNNTQVRIILDPDAKKKQDKIANLLFQYGIDISVVDLEGEKDIADIFLEEGNFDNLLKNEYVWERKGSLLSKINTMLTGSY